MGNYVAFGYNKSNRALFLFVEKLICYQQIYILGWECGNSKMKSTDAGYGWADACISSCLNRSLHDADEQY